MPAGAPTNPDQQCTAMSKSTGQRCKSYAMVGLKVCMRHGGRAPRARAKSELAKAQRVVERQVRALGGGKLDVNPSDWMLDQLHEAAYNVAMLRDFVTALGIGVGNNGAIAIPEQVVEFEKGGTHVPARIHVLVDMYNAERDRSMKFAKAALDAGIEERRVRLAETQAQRLWTAVGRALDRLAEHLDPDTVQQFRIDLANELRQLTPVTP